MGSAGRLHYLTMTTESPTPGDLALAPLVTCKLCLCEQSLDKMTTLQECRCIFCTACLKQYMQLAIQEGCGSPITCPDMVCLNHGTLQEAEIACLVPVDQFQLYQRLKFEREVHLDPYRTWCPVADCQTVCRIAPGDPEQPVLVECPSCHLKFCSCCKDAWHAEVSCRDSQSVVLPTEHGALFGTDADAPIKQCPVCRVYIERNEGCAQMMCKNCKHTFCWYCLQNLDNDIFLRHYDKGPCRNKLGHSRASVMWNRTQVVGILVGLGIIALVTSPLLLLASRASSVVSASPVGARRKSMTHLQPKDLCVRVATDVLYIPGQHSDKAPLSELSSSLLPSFEVPLCPYFELACPPAASERPGTGACVLCQQNQVLQSWMCLWST